MEREKLRNVLNATVSSHGGDVFYYQGLHDITSVLLFTGGERLALLMLRRLVTCHLRDCTRCAAASLLLYMMHAVCKKHRIVCPKDVFSFVSLPMQVGDASRLVTSTEHFLE